MGTIVSPANGSTFSHGATIPVVYRSDTVNFGCVTFSTEVCQVSYFVDGIPVVEFISISQTGAAPQTQATQNITLPLTGTTVTITVAGDSVTGITTDTATATYNLIAAASPVATCDPATFPTQAGLTLNVAMAGVPADGLAVIRYGTVSGGPYESFVYVPLADGSTSVSVTGLAANTTYYYILEITDETDTIVATSGECQGTTLEAIIPVGVDAQVVKLCSITGVTLMQDCEFNEPILLVTVTSSDGDVINVNSTEFPAAAGQGVFTTMGYYRSYYTDLYGNYLNPQPTDICSASPLAAQIEMLCKCDDTNDDGLPDVAYREIVSIDGSGEVTVLSTYTDDLSAAYTPVSPVACVPGESLIQAIPRYTVITGANVWALGSNSAIPTLSVAFTVILVGNTANPPTITDAFGTNPLYPGQVLGWTSIHARDVIGLAPPLSLTTRAGDVVAVNWLEESA